MVKFTVLDNITEYHDHIADFIPIFIFSIAMELFVNVIFKKKKNYHSLDDSLSSMGTGISTIVLERVVPYTILASIEFAGAIYIYQNYRIIDVSEYSIAAWILCFFTIDFCYYWFHRFAHEINAVWATHVTHHSSEKYNLTTALRQSIFQQYLGFLVFLPLGLFTPPGIYVFHKQFNTINQFWIHTQLIGKLPWIIEFIFNTPSHHRVHHGRNPKYLDKNYGGTLIIWDRIFGTFEPEEEKVYYGLVHPLESNDPTWSQIHHWVEMYNESKLYSSIKDKIYIFIMGPGWKKGTSRFGDLSQVPIPTDIDEQSRISKSLSTDLNIYLFVHYILASFLALTLRAAFEDQVGSINVTLSFIFVYFSLTSFASIFDRKSYSLILECIRLWSFILFTIYIESTSIVLYCFRITYFISSIYIIVFKKLLTSTILKNHLLSLKKRILYNKFD